MKNKLLSIFLVLVMLASLFVSVLPVFAASPFIGHQTALASTANVTGGGAMTVVDKNNPSFFTGFISQVQIYLNSYAGVGSITNLSVATFSVSGTSVTTHDYDSTKSGLTYYGDSLYTFPVNLAVSIGDYIGFSYTAAGGAGGAYIEPTGGDGYLYDTTNDITRTSASFTFNASSQVEIRAIVNGVGAYTAKTVQTYGSYYDAFGILILKGDVLSLGNNTSADCYFEYGLDNTYGEETPHIYGFGTVTGVGVNGYFTSPVPEMFIPPPGTVLHFRAVAVFQPSGAVGYGGDKTETIASILLIETLPVTNLMINSASIGAQIPTMGGTETSVAVMINWGITPDLAETPLTLYLTATVPDSWIGTLVGLQPNTTYYYQAEAIGVANYFGVTIPFTTLSAVGGGGKGGGGKVIDTANNWLSTHGMSTSWWWVIIAALMMLPWLVPYIREHGIMGIIIDVVILGAGITLVLDIWVTIILAILAAAIIGGIFIKKVVAPG